MPEQAGGGAGSGKASQIPEQGESTLPDIPLSLAISPSPREYSLESTIRHSDVTHTAPYKGLLGAFWRASRLHFGGSTFIFSYFGDSTSIIYIPVCLARSIHCNWLHFTPREEFSSRCSFLKVQPQLLGTEIENRIA